MIPEVPKCYIENGMRIFFSEIRQTNYFDQFNAARDQIADSRDLNIRVSRSLYRPQSKATKVGSQKCLVILAPKTVDWGFANSFPLPN